MSEALQLQLSQAAKQLLLLAACTIAAAAAVPLGCDSDLMPHTCKLTGESNCPFAQCPLYCL